SGGAALFDSVSGYEYSSEESGFVNGDKCWCKITGPYQTYWINQGKTYDSIEYCSDACVTKMKNDSGFGAKILRDSVMEISEDEKCKPIEYNITYIMDNGVNNPENPKTYTVEQLPLNFAEPTRDGYAFQGWFTDPEFDTEITEIPENTNRDITVYAKWKVVCETGYKEVTLAKSTIPDTSGWTTTMYKASSTASFADSTWSATVKAFTDDSGNVVPITGWAALFDATSGYEDSEESAGYVGGGKCWCKVAEPYLTKWVNSGKTSTSGPDCASKCATKMTDSGFGKKMLETYVIQGSENEKDETTCEAIEYTITYNLNGGINYTDAPTTYTVATPTITLETPTKQNYKFMGWTDANNTTISNIPTGSTGNITLYAQWKLDYCNANEYKDGETCIACPDGLVSPMKSEDSGSCGRKLHIGNEIVYLRSQKKTTPSLNVDVDNDGVADFFGNMSTIPTNINKDSNHKLKFEYNNQIMYLYDDTIKEIAE
ncbi:MAG: InlB B-repeat-containing protein, partial [Alphaproteobacteria bacterium]|nr:InlB B-repeat-containing protein [Alphaproteobacteria bacterium]